MAVPSDDGRPKRGSVAGSRTCAVVASLHSAARRVMLGHGRVDPLDRTLSVNLAVTDDGTVVMISTSKE